MLKVTIEDTGLGVTFAGDPGKYRVWKAVDPVSGDPYLLLTRSAIHYSPLAPRPEVKRYVEVTEADLDLDLAELLKALQDRSAATANGDSNV